MGLTPSLDVKVVGTPLFGVQMLGDGAETHTLDLRKDLRYGLEYYSPGEQVVVASARYKRRMTPCQYERQRRA